MTSVTSSALGAPGKHSMISSRRFNPVPGHPNRLSLLVDEAAAIEHPTQVPSGTRPESGPQPGRHGREPFHARAGGYPFGGEKQ
jgi:hypothetical protein